MSKLEFAKQHIDILGPIELMVCTAFQDGVLGHDFEVMHIYDALIVYYRAITTKYPLPVAKFALETELTLYELLIEEFKNEDPKLMLDCAKQLQKSVRKWNRERGSRGYLEFISSFFS